jgi:hypothetical protein
MARALPGQTTNANFFYGGFGTDTSGVYTYGYQTIDLSSVSATGLPYTLSAYLSGESTQPDWAEVLITFENASGATMGQAQVGGSSVDSAAARGNNDGALASLDFSIQSSEPGTHRPRSPLRPPPPPRGCGPPGGRHLRERSATGWPGLLRATSVARLQRPDEDHVSWPACFPRSGRCGGAPDGVGAGEHPRPSPRGRGCPAQ